MDCWGTAPESGPVADRGQYRTAETGVTESPTSTSGCAIRRAAAHRIEAQGAVLTGMEKSMLESPVFCQIHPAVVFLFPAAMAELANHSRGEGGFRQSGDPQPFVIRAMPGAPAPRKRFRSKTSSERTTRTGSGLSRVKGRPSVSQS